MNVLVIDDSHEDCFLIKKILEKAFSDLNINFAYTLEEAGKIIKDPTLDFILLDYTLPDGDGLEFLKSLNEKPYTIPVIVITGRKDEQLEKEVLEAGAQDYLLKENLNNDQLIKSIEHSLERIFNLRELQSARQQTIEALRVKEDFMSIMTHELLTPLTGIINGVQLLRSDIDDHNIERSLELCDIIEESGNSLHKTINNILEYTSLDGSTIALYLDQIELESLIIAIKSHFNDTVCKKGLKFTIELNKSAPVILNTDLKRVKQIIYNLISNAIKFTSKGEIKITFAEVDHQLLFEISDTGKGIKEQYLNNIFSEFTQEDTSYSRNFDGTGLGLSIVKKIVVLLGGKIQVKSKFGSGSTFTVLLPYK
ncbi:MAG: hybrid sensor histidine kinase/response regulator [Lentisphaeraceae bacterium]|nr:hybrid sensor histidine kinase/response regulator [Lentisphaeraceae bacterium]